MEIKDMTLADMTPADMTPEELRAPLMEAVIAHVPFDGWSTAALNAAAEDIGVTPEMAELAYPGGTADMLEAFLARGDAKLEEAIEGLDLPSLKIRERITEAVRLKLTINSEARECVRRTVQTLALPVHAKLGADALWRTSDLIWRGIGDSSTDHNWYSKRATLSAVYSATLLYWLTDDSDDQKETDAFLKRRIEDVMQIEKAKFQMRKMTANLPSLTRFLSQIRYPGARV